MSIITLIVGAVLGLSVVSVLLLIWRSAEGHEDENGFHPGADDKSPDAQANEESKVAPPNVASPGVTTPIQVKR
jgi:hypothetical protein